MLCYFCHTEIAKQFSEQNGVYCVNCLKYPGIQIVWSRDLSLHCYVGIVNVISRFEYVDKNMKYSISLLNDNTTYIAVTPYSDADNYNQKLSSDKYGWKKVATFPNHTLNPNNVYKKLPLYLLFS